MSELPDDRFDAIRRRFIARLGQNEVELHRLATDPEAGQSIVEIVHKIAGIAGSLGYPELSRVALDHEKSTLENPDVHPASLPEFPIVLSAIKDALSEA